MQGSSLLPVTQTHHLHVTANSFPPIQYLAKPWLLLLLSFRPGFPVHPCTKDSQPLSASQHIYTTAIRSMQVPLASLHWPVLQLHWKLSSYFSFLFTTILKVISVKEEILFQCKCACCRHTLQSRRDDLYWSLLLSSQFCVTTATHTK